MIHAKENIVFPCNMLELEYNRNDLYCVNGIYLMTTVQLRKYINQRLKKLSADRLRAASHFIDYLQECEEDPATLELLSIKGIRSGLARAERQANSGKTVPLSKARRNV